LPITITGRVPRRRDGERVELREHRRRTEAVRGSEPRQVDRHRAPARSREHREHLPPGVGAVGVAVEHQHRHAVPLQLQRARLIPRELEPVLEQRLDHAATAGSGA
jgi:hypothetical protein